MPRCFFPVFFLALTTLCAQNAAVSGRVTDSSGAVVPAAKVTARNPLSGASFSTESSAEGYYSLPSLTPGRYDIEIAKAGFVTQKQNGLELAVQQAARLDVALKIGVVAETMEVNAQALVLESENSTLGQVIGNKQVTELPLLGRNTYALAMLVPGVRPGLVNRFV